MPNETDVPFPDAQNVGKVYLHLAEIYGINVGEYSMHLAHMGLRGMELFCFSGAHFQWMVIFVGLGPGGLGFESGCP